MTEQVFLPGLQPFETAQAAHFTGQQALAQDIYSTWRHQGEHGRTFLALLGPRDSGKSSLLRAGVLPLLEQDTDLNAKDWRYAIWYPSDDLDIPMQGLATALLKALPELEQKQHMHTEQLAKLLTEHGTAAELLLKTTLDLLAKMPVQPSEDTPITRLVLLVENLEHLLLPQFSLAQRELVCERLAGLASSGRCWVLASLDEMYLEQMNACPNFAKLLAGTGQYRLQPPQAEQWQNILHASLPEAAVDSGLYTQIFHAVQQQPYPLSAVQAVFALVAKNQDWQPADNLSEALKQLLQQELSDFPTEERTALQTILQYFALGQDEHQFYTCRQPVSKLGHTETQRETLKRLLNKQWVWQEKQGEAVWIGANASVLQSLHTLCENEAEIVPATAAAATQTSPNSAYEDEELDKKAAFKRYFPWRPALVMGLLGVLLGAAVAFLPQYKYWANMQIAQVQEWWQSWQTEAIVETAANTPFPQDPTSPKTVAAESNNTTSSSALPSLPDKPPLLAQTLPDREREAVSTQLKSVNVADISKPEVRPQTDTSPARLDELAVQQIKQKKWTKALALYEQALDIRLSLRTGDESDIGLLKELSRNYDQIGNLQKRLDHPKAALLSYSDALSVSQKLFAHDPKDAANQRDLAISHQRIGDLQVSEKEYDNAEKSHVNGVKYFKQAAETQKTRRNQSALANAYDKLGEVQSAKKDTKAALASYQSALSVRQELLQRYRDQSSQQAIAYSHHKINSLWQTMR